MRALWTRFGLIGVGVGLALAFGVHAPLDLGAAGFAAALAAIGAVYLGALIAAPQPRAAIRQEGAAAATTFGLAGLGLLAHPLWLVPGHFGRGLWDRAHRGGRHGARVASWYPPFRAGVDLAMGGVVLALFMP